MTKEERQEREREEMRILILETAGQLIAEGGIGKLSIRKIADKIEYSPGIIYHYFQGKEDIIEQVLQKGYLDMVSGLNSGQAREQIDQSPEALLKQSLRQFIRMSLSEGSQYRNVMLNDSPAVLSHTAVLFKGAAQDRQALGMLCQCLRQFEQMSTRDDIYVERTAQVIWSAAFGLILRITVEKDLPEEQREALITHYLEAMLAVATK
ncbi:TetR/AcrR family transcriptional regulator [Paenibacillus sp. 19GGS1-52]|uniref:TetR/AcrR family transcriptional regulator n=1 Tax=Paenibacillus sp. 19GGS1-52 TaxID=2758563 RepID=UPI001EFB1E53|nr:TetR/AcrR family transcriptional regulator [Paenibacillus sp. 19GGS1-52]ULO10071.1 TetR/AcrR family transcriptional regulator [Paenibacillus sp. 19GGS1-52]